MTEPIVIQPILMRSIGDCAICCLVMLTGRSYVEVMNAIPKKLRGNAMFEGLLPDQAIAVARRLGVVLQYWETPEDDNERGWTRDDAIGIIYMTRPMNDDGHMVVYFNGSLFNPADGEIWTDLDAFLIRGKWEVEGFLWRVK